MCTQLFQHDVFLNLQQLLWALKAAASMMTQTQHEVTTAWVELAAHN